MKPLRALVLPAGLLAAAQVWHAVTPTPEVRDAAGKIVDEGSYVGLVGGLLLLLGSIVISIAARREVSWVRPLSIAVGLGVSVGFLMYHATAFHSPLTNPYIGTEGIGFVQWLPVFVCMGIGGWLVRTAWPARETAGTTAAA